jgi:hypothetical protein
VKADHGLVVVVLAVRPGRVSTGQMLGRLGALAVVVGVGLGVIAAGAAADTVPLTLSATVGPEGTSIFVEAPGCQPTPPGEFDIFVQARSATGEIGEGAVAVGTFTAPGQGSVLIPGGTPVNSFLLTVSCNGGALTASQLVTLTAPAAPLVAAARFTG